MAKSDVQFRIFSCALGFFGLVWGPKGLKNLTFPQPNRKKVLSDLLGRQATAKLAVRTPKWIREIAKEIQHDLGAMPGLVSTAARLKAKLDFDEVPEFHQAIYLEAMQIPRGQCISYGELAKRAGSSKAARAAGQAMAKNPWPLIVPCHRVLAARGRIGGFSAPGGIESKARLLEIEGRPLEPRTILKNFNRSAVVRELRARDPKLGHLIRKVGTFDLEIKERLTPYHWLLRSIIYQQLNGRAAATIHARVRALFEGRDPKPDELLEASDSRLSSAGLSRQKLAALKDLARAAKDGLVPSMRKMQRMSDDEIVAALTPIRGVGRWTVEMLLIFGLGRTDVLAVDDFAIRKSAMLLHGLGEMPDRHTFNKIGEKWRPYRTVASWYLWRSLGGTTP